MENLQNLTNLQELWLGRNRIKMVNLWTEVCQEAKLTEQSFDLYDWLPSKGLL